jgi:hypothetical protein
MSWDAGVPLATQDFVQNLTVGNTTTGKVLVPVTPGRVMNAVSGEADLPNEGSVRQRVFQGGARVTTITAASTDSASNSLILREGILLSQFDGQAGSGAMPVIASFGSSGTITGQNTINRQANSFLADGVQIGDKHFIWGDSVAANNGVIVQVTAVTALAITYSGTLLTNNAALAAGFQIYKIAQSTENSVPANSGNSNSIPNVELLGALQSQNRSWDQTGLSLGANGILIVSMAGNVSALPASVDVTAKALLY